MPIYSLAVLWHARPDIRRDSATLQFTLSNVFFTVYLFSGMFRIVVSETFEIVNVVHFHLIINVLVTLFFMIAVPYHAFMNAINCIISKNVKLQYV